MDHFSIIIIDDDERGKPEGLTLSTDWCRCGNETFGCYPEDGACECGVYKHHVHCGSCGAITQVG